MKLDTNQEGLYALYSPHEAEILKHLWDTALSVGDAKNSRYVHNWQLEALPDIGLKSKSRATIINFLNELVNDGVLDYKERTGKGGYHRMYWIRLKRDDFEGHVRKTIADKLDEIFGVTKDG